MENVTRGQRAFWSALITTLAAPLLGGLIVLLLSLGAGALGKGPDSLKALDTAGQWAWAAEKALATFVWSALPAAAAGAILAALILARGAFGWLEAATVGAVVVSAGAWLTGGLVLQHLVPVATIAAVVGIAMWRMLTRGGVVPR
jgi:hypothetical protein